MEHWAKPKRSKRCRTLGYKPGLNVMTGNHEVIVTGGVLINIFTNEEDVWGGLNYFYYLNHFY